jgi:hypothetical protein
VVAVRGERQHHRKKLQAGEQAMAVFSDALTLSYRDSHPGRDSNPQPSA